MSQLNKDFIYSPHEPTVPFDLGSTKEYFQTLPETNINKQYFNGLKYEIKTDFYNRHRNFFTLEQKLDTLNKFYPYQKQINETRENIEQDKLNYLSIHKFQLFLQTLKENSVLFTGASWTFLFQYGRKGQVFPILKEYGSVLQTHRLFRQYLYTLVLPAAYAFYHIHDKYNDHIEILWKTHANRLNNKILNDPYKSEYPEELRSPRRRIFENNYH